MRPLLVLTLFLAGCASTAELTMSPAGQVVPAASVAATLTTGAAGQQVLIEDPSALPADLRSALKLEVVAGGAKVPVARSATGALSFSLAANARVEQDLAGTLQVLFVVDDLRTWAVALRTAAEVRFDALPVVTAPAPAVVTRGFPVTLRAATATTDATHQFTWAWAAAAAGPWQPIPETGKSVEWEPAQAGNFFVRVEAVDRVRGRVQSVVTPTAVVFVREADEAFTSDPASGQVVRDEPVTLRFAAPPELGTGPRPLAWSVGTSVQGPWIAIPGDAAEIRWEPPTAGSWFVRVEAADAKAVRRTFVSPRAVVVATEGPERIRATEPAGGAVAENQAVTLAFAPPAGLVGDAWAWSAAMTAQGPWTPIAGAGASVRWRPTAPGAWFVRVQAPDQDLEIRTFTSGKPIVVVANVPDRIRVAQASAERGDAVGLTLSGATGTGPYTWSYARVPAGQPLTTANWIRMPGTGVTTRFVPTDVGAFAFRVEAPDPAGGLDADQTDEAVLLVNETQPVIQSDPPLNIVRPGSRVSLVLNARGLAEDEHNFAWYTAPGPTGPFSLIPAERTAQLRSKRRTWDTQEPRSINGITIPGTAPGQYFVRVQASRRDGTASYTFTSDAPVVTVIDD